MSQPASNLAEELSTYQAQLANWTGQEGRYAVIAADEVIGVFDTYTDALTAGYKARGLAPFLVKQIAAVSMVANFTRDLRPACHISA